MNKLLVNSEDNINNLVIGEDTELTIRLNDIEKNINIIIEENICLNIVEISKNSSNMILIELNNNSRLLYNKFGLNCSDRIEINLNGENCSLEFSNSLINIDDLECCEKIVHNNKNTTSNIFNKGINFSKNSLNISVDVKINKNSNNSNSTQDNKVININGGKSLVLPNLLVDNKDVCATHSTYIGDFDKEGMFYLKSRGIKEENCKRLLIEGLLFDKTNVNSKYKDEIINLIGGEL